jgi:hypothetical protein
MAQVLEAARRAGIRVFHARCTGDIVPAISKAGSSGSDRFIWKQ